MSDLCQRLLNLQETGVYRLNCNRADLLESVQKNGFKLFEVDLTVAQGTGEVLAEFARAIAAPDWFGHNWDALADALGDLSWQVAAGYVVLLQGPLDEASALGCILADTVDYWRQQGKAFWVFQV